MSEKIYVIHHRNSRNTDYKKELQEINDINPDKILLFCLEESDASYIFREAFIKLSPFLVENKKFAKVLVPHPDGVELAPNIITEKTFGYHLVIKSVMEKFDILGIDFTKSHTYATKLYTCYNNVMKYHRAKTIDLLAKEKLIGDGIVTVISPHYIQPDYNQYGAKTFNWKYYDNKIRKDEAELDHLYIAYNSGTMAKSFLKGFMDIVTETHYYHRAHMLTEKTAKSIIALKPFLCVSGPNFHKYLQDEYGIESYYEIFDYSFDRLDDLDLRIKGVIDNVKRYHDLLLDRNKLEKIHDLLLPKMLKNKANLYNYSCDKNKMIPNSLRSCVESNDYELFGDVDDCMYVFDYYRDMGWMKK